MLLFTVVILIAGGVLGFLIFWWAVYDETDWVIIVSSLDHELRDLLWNRYTCDGYLLGAYKPVLGRGKQEGAEKESETIEKSPQHQEGIELYGF